jgi:hypothetical protein
VGGAGGGTDGQGDGAGGGVGEQGLGTGMARLVWVLGFPPIRQEKGEWMGTESEVAAGRRSFDSAEVRFAQDDRFLGRSG